MSFNKSLDEENDLNNMASYENIADETKDETSQYATRNRPFACPVCNKRFTQKAHLIIHKRIHTGEKPYSCHICHRKFAQSSHLTVHKRVHTGEKPFFCNFCGMGFCRRPRLEAHILQHVVKEGRQIPSTLKGNMLKNLSMVGLENVDAPPNLNLNQFVEVKDGLGLEVKTEPPDDVESSKEVLDEIFEKSSECDQVRKRRKPEFVRKLRSHEKLDTRINGNQEETIKDDIQLTNGKNLLRLSPDDIEKIAYSFADLTELQKHFQQASPKNTPSVTSLVSPNSRLHHNPTVVNSGLARTNSRISLVDFTAEDILQHLMTRDDVRSCNFCCIVFHDPAMYYLHRSMHDKMDVRCCNLCGKLLVDKYDFTAHFLNQHK